ncbi:Glycosyltransferase [Thioalkalivibrio nitratireducens DSM 14787]|uniref:Glycosyltransferase n=1 Tax=Thioalkalivibrio nitratireducens (strain DSM 14787 / UNIQEM 213 / ALEN2) TaxID=1255043 RepID=L0DVN9_THIND|nr:glycosyltransferase family 4 protein [Thioalkalivibrio nitratireducens]AGA32396.1 Glycosyltransferase [Thioalkalivibrio nitratireducens DSM 14787]
MTDVRFFNTYEPVSPFYRDLIPLLSARGLDAEVVLSSREYRAGRKPLEESLGSDRVGIRRIRAGRGVVLGRSQKLWAMLTYVIGAAGSSLFGPRARLNFFLTQPPLFSLWGLVLRWLRRQPYCCLVMDVYPDVAVRDGLLKAGGLATRFLTYVSRSVLRRADAVIVIGRCMRERMEQHGIASERLHLVPNWVNDAEVQPVEHERNALRKELGLEGKFVVLYSGNMGVSHFLDDILETARRLWELPDLVFVFIGDGPRRREVVGWQERFDLKNIRLLPFQPTERLAESLSLGDVHFLSLRAGFEGLVVPSKAYGALGAGRPILYQGESTGEIARMIEEERIGSVVPLNSPDSLTSVLRRYYDHPTLAANEGQRALELNRQKYGRQHAVSEYLRLIEKLLGKDVDQGN